MAHILVIDDSLFIRKAICAVAKALGHETKEAADGQAGLELVDTQPFDCIVTDLLMPKLDGFGVTRFDPMGAPFDATLHEAVSSVPTTDPSQDHVVVGVLTPGYLVGGEVLRPARVAVAQLTG